MSNPKIAIVTGGNRGIGREICRQLASMGNQVILTARNVKKGQAAAQEMDPTGKSIRFHPLNVTDPDSIHEIAAFTSREYGRLDILINNAAILVDEGQDATDIHMDDLRRAFDTNFFGPFELTQSLLPLLRQSAAARIINISSGMGELCRGMGSGYPAYRLSKTALNAFTSNLSQELHSTTVKVFSVCPGWVRTDMGGAGATRSVEKGAETPVWLATTDENVESGKFYRDKAVISW